MKTYKLFLILIILLCCLFSSSIGFSEAPAINASPEEFSFVWISDTQTLTEKPSLAGSIPDIFDWIIRTRKDYNTLAVFHTGDIVENGWNDAYWERINKGIDQLPPDLPFIAAAGNHDVAKKRPSYEPWTKQNFVKNQIPEHQYGNGEGYYCLFYPKNEKIISVSIGYNSINEEGMKWVRDTFSKYPDHTGILIVHSFLSYNTQETSTFTKHGKKLYDEVVVPCENIRLVLCGHIGGSHTYSLTLDNKDGDTRTVNMLRYDCQYASNVDLIGYIRILRFDPADRSMEVLTYSPIQDNMHYRFWKPQDEHFILPNAF